MIKNNIIILLICAIFTLSCKGGTKNSNHSVKTKVTNSVSSPTMYKGEVVAAKSRERDSYTQGYEFYNGNLYESSGLYNQSYLRIVEYPSFNELKRVKVDNKYFAEGITILNNKLYMITWKENRCLVYNPLTLILESTFTYNGEGWGLTNDGEYIYMSDGSSTIFKRNPKTFEIVDRIEVKIASTNEKVNMLNELEWIDGKIWANVYTTDYVVVIEPKSGNVEKIYDFRATLPQSLREKNTDVLNGIAQEPKSGKIFITGKYWPRIFEIKQ